MNNPCRFEMMALRFAVAPLLVYLLAIFILEFGGLGFTDTAAFVESSVKFSTQLSPSLLAINHARMSWLLAVLMFWAVVLTVLVVCISTMRATLSSTGFRLFLLCGAAMSVGGVIQLWISAESGSSLGLIFRFTYASIQASQQFNAADLTAIKLLVSSVNILAAVAPGFVMLAGCSLLAIPADRDCADPRHFLRRRMADLKTVTDLGSALLVAGSLHMLLWLRWPIVFSADPVMRQAIGEWALSVTLYCGTAYSLMIALFYMPCAFALTKNAEIMLQRALPDMTEPDVADWLEQYGFSKSVVRHLPQIIAALAPMLAGPIGSALTGLGGFLG